MSNLGLFVRQFQCPSSLPIHCAHKFISLFKPTRPSVWTRSCLLAHAHRNCGRKYPYLRDPRQSTPSSYRTDNWEWSDK